MGACHEINNRIQMRWHLLCAYHDDHQHRTATTAAVTQMQQTFEHKRIGEYGECYSKQKTKDELCTIRSNVDNHDPM